MIKEMRMERYLYKSEDMDHWIDMDEITFTRVQNHLSTSSNRKQKVRAH